MSPAVTRTMTALVCLCWAGAAIVSAGEAAPRPPRQPKAAVEVPGAGNALDVPYLGPERDVLHESEYGQERQVRLNVHWPQGGGRHPCVLFVHGGSNTGGHKDHHSGSAHSAKLAGEFVAKGFTVANLNYILGNDIYPQLFWDLKAAVRFLRANAERFHIDPDRIGAWGWSAGGWDVSTIAFADAGDLAMHGNPRGSSGLDPAAIASLAGRARGTGKGGPRLLVPMDAPEPVHAEHSARLQAISVDFFWNHHLATPDDPAVSTYTGEGATSPLQAPCEAAGLPFLAIPLKGKKDAVLHVPSLDSRTAGEDGGEVDARTRVLQFFVRHLQREPRAVAPEFRPNRRVFAGSTTVSLVGASPDTVFHVTVDGSPPTAASPRYEKPFAISATTVVKAIAIKPGMAPSGIATAIYTAGRPPPVVSGPDALPPARVGQPWTATFSAEGGAPLAWAASLQLSDKVFGRETPGSAFDSEKPNPLGLGFDRATATLSGTPTRAGNYVLQVHCGRAYGELAGSRTWILRVE